MTSLDTDNIDAFQHMIGDDYRLKKVIGRGGMSTVWLADDVRHGCEVAVKVLKPEFSDNFEFLSRFRREAEAAENLHHPNVVATYDYRELVDDDDHNFCFIVMELVRGESLADLITREGKLQESRALNLLEQAAFGLSTIHEMNLVHRDMKPGNIMITEHDQVKITDFGIAKAASAVPLTTAGMVVGTAQYVSPEQAQGIPVSAASDVYSLAVVGYEMLSGKRPFNGDSSVSVAIAHIREPVPPLDTSISAPTRELISIGLRKDSRRRYANGSEFAEAISQARLCERPFDPVERREAEKAAAEARATYEAERAAAAAAARAEQAAKRRTAGAPAMSQQVVKEEPQSKLGLAISALLIFLFLIGAAAWAVMSTRGVGEPTPASEATEVDYAPEDDGYGERATVNPIQPPNPNPVTSVHGFPVTVTTPPPAEEDENAEGNNDNNRGDNGRGNSANPSQPENPGVVESSAPAPADDEEAAATLPDEGSRNGSDNGVSPGGGTKPQETASMQVPNSGPVVNNG